MFEPTAFPLSCGLMYTRHGAASRWPAPGDTWQELPMIDLAAALPRLLPLAIPWVESQEADVLATGRSLTVTELALAKAVGVSNVTRVRIKLVNQMPQPSHPELRAAADQTGLLGPNTRGVTFGYAVFIRHGCETNRLVSHELRHVHQYEAAGSIAAFLPIYLAQIVSVGYGQAPFELDAKRHERDVP
jgi:hypothetical protein